MKKIIIMFFMLSSLSFSASFNKNDILFLNDLYEISAIKDNNQGYSKNIENSEFYYGKIFFFSSKKNADEFFLSSILFTQSFFNDYLKIDTKDMDSIAKDYLKKKKNLIDLSVLRIGKDTLFQVSLEKTNDKDDIYLVGITIFNF